MIFEALLFVEWVIGVSQVSGEKGGKEIETILKYIKLRAELIVLNR